MRKKDLISTIAKKQHWTHKKATHFVNQLFNQISLEIKTGNTITLKNIGTFSKTKKAKRRIIHPTTKEAIILPEREAIIFTASKTTTNQLNKGLKK